MKGCSLSDCRRPHLAHGYCNLHYRRWRRHGDPKAGQQLRGEAHAWLKQHVAHQSEDCLIWPFTRGADGRAMLSNLIVARLMCKLAHGEPPSEAHQAAHSCGKGHEGCVNPAHLRWATCSENHADKLVHGTDHRGEKCPTSKLTDAEARQILALKGREPGAGIARRFGVSAATVSMIHSGHRWGWMQGIPTNTVFDQA